MRSMNSASCDEGAGNERPLLSGRWVVTQSGFDINGRVVIVSTDPPSGGCPSCESQWLLRKDGRLKRHMLHPGGYNCPGHGRLPTPIPAWTTEPPAKHRPAAAVTDLALSTTPAQTDPRLVAQVDLPGFSLEVVDAAGQYAVTVNGVRRHWGDADAAIRAMAHYLLGFVYQSLTPAQRKEFLEAGGSSS